MLHWKHPYVVYLQYDLQYSFQYGVQYGLQYGVQYGLLSTSFLDASFGKGCANSGINKPQQKHQVTKDKKHQERYSVKDKPNIVNPFSMRFFLSMREMNLYFLIRVTIPYKGIVYENVKKYPKEIEELFVNATKALKQASLDTRKLAI